MPLYVYECAPCNKSRSDMRRIAERNDAPECDGCKALMKLVLGATPGIVKDPAVPKQRHRAK